MIIIKKSQVADTRTCEYTKVTKEQLRSASLSHIADVTLALMFFAEKINKAAIEHDRTKLSELDSFHSDFTTGFKITEWWDMHRKTERHHINSADGVREDIDLIDVLEYISDCVMAGMARSGSVTPVILSDDVLQKAFRNTVDKLKQQVSVEGK